MNELALIKQIFDERRRSIPPITAIYADIREIERRLNVNDNLSSFVKLFYHKNHSLEISDQPSNIPQNLDKLNLLRKLETLTEFLEIILPSQLYYKYFCEVCNQVQYWTYLYPELYFLLDWASQNNYSTLLCDRIRQIVNKGRPARDESETWFHGPFMIQSPWDQNARRIWGILHELCESGKRQFYLAHNGARSKIQDYIRDLRGELKMLEMMYD